MVSRAPFARAVPTLPNRIEPDCDPRSPVIGLACLICCNSVNHDVEYRVFLIVHLIQLMRGILVELCLRATYRPHAR